MKAKLLPLCLCVLFLAGCSAIANKINQLVHDTIEKTGTEMMGVPVLVDSVNISLSSGAGELNGFTIANPQGYTDPYAFSMDQIRFNLDVGSISGSPKRIQEFILDTPAVTIQVLDDDRVNLEEIARNMQEKMAAAAPAEQPADTKAPAAEAGEDPAATLLAIDILRVTGVKLTLRHRKLEEGVKELILPDIEMKNVGGTTGITGAEISVEIIKAISRKGMENALKDELQKEAGKFLDSLKISQESKEGESSEGGEIENIGNSLLNRFK